jgi:uncharacterized membrane protein YhaH (DUF805 family)
MSTKTPATKKTPARKPAAKKAAAKTTAVKKTSTRKPAVRKSRAASDTFLPFFQTLLDNFIAVMKKYTVHTGRASRKEFWLFVLAGLIIGIAFGILAIIPIVGIIAGIVSLLFGLATIIPSIMVGIRRLHDTNKTGWLMLLLLIPLVGWILVLVLCALQGTSGKNRYGPAPKDV